MLCRYLGEKHYQRLVFFYLAITIFILLAYHIEFVECEVLKKFICYLYIEWHIEALQVICIFLGISAGIANLLWLEFLGVHIRITISKRYLSWICRNVIH